MKNVFILLFFTMFIKELMFLDIYLTNNIKILICHVLHYISLSIFLNINEINSMSYLDIKCNIKRITYDNNLILN